MGVNAAVVDDSLACTAVAAAPVASSPSASAKSTAAALVGGPPAGVAAEAAVGVPMPVSLSVAPPSSLPAATLRLAAADAGSWDLDACRRAAASVAAVPVGMRELPAVPTAVLTVIALKLECAGESAACVAAKAAAAASSSVSVSVGAGAVDTGAVVAPAVAVCPGPWDASPADCGVAPAAFSITAAAPAAVGAAVGAAADGTLIGNGNESAVASGAVAVAVGGTGMPGTGKVPPPESAAAALFCTLLRLGLSAAADRAPAKSGVPALFCVSTGGALDCGALLTGALQDGTIAFIAMSQQAACQTLGAR